MDKVVYYRQLVQSMIAKYAEEKPSFGEVDIQVVFDEQLDHYQLLYAGWDEPYRIYGPVLHIDIKDGKIWIQHDGTMDAVADRLVDAGVPKEDIVLAYKAPSMRELTGYAVG